MTYANYLNEVGKLDNTCNSLGDIPQVAVRAES